MAPSETKRFSSWETAKRNACVNIIKCILVLIQAGIFYAVWHFIYRSDLGLLRDLASTGIYTMLFAIMCVVYDAFAINQSRIGEVAYSLTLAQLFALFFQYLILCLVTNTILNPLGLLVALAAGAAANMLCSVWCVRTYRRLFPAQYTYVICRDAAALKEAYTLNELSWKFRIAEFLELDQGMDEVFRKIASAQAVILVDIHSSDRNQILKYCIDSGIQVYIRPRIGDLLLRGGYQLQLLNVPVIHCGRFRKNMTYLFIKRTADIVLSGLALVVLSPIMIAVALVIHFYDGGPAIYRQVRLTKDGREFEILKFRSMRVDAEKDGVARLSSEGDSRITPVGRFIRAVRFDELPQLINILKGDMSIVGPRPERPEIAAQYEKEMPEFSLRLQAKAGLTGYAQVYGKYNTLPYDKLQMDLLYIAKQSVLQDLKLMFVTVKVLFMKESTEGVDQGQVTAAK